MLAHKYMCLLLAYSMPLSLLLHSLASAERLTLTSTQTLKYETVGHEWERQIQDVPVPVSRAGYRSIDQDRIATPTRTVTSPTSQPRSVSPVTYRPHDHTLYTESYSSPKLTTRWKFSNVGFL